MPQITLPDGSKKKFDKPLSVADAAAAIGPGLAKAALAGRLDGELVDLSHPIERDAELAVITGKEPEGLDMLRHSCAHLMAQAVQRLYPKAQVTIGPVIEDGFYYDFAFERPFTPEDLTAIEEAMAAIVKEDLPVERSVMGRTEAVAMFKKMGEEYKVQIIESIPGDEELSFYRQGEFIDLCRGPHVPSTGRHKAFKLTGVAGAYWRGDSRNEMLQRIYGTAWASKQDLKDHLHRLEEAEKRDHRKLGKRLGLFHFQQEAPGLVFWHPKGWTLYETVRNYMRQVQAAGGYQEINTPQLVDYSLWEQSGHADKFAEEMFSVESESRMYALKPMNCPCHIQVFKQGLKSYRDLPLRFAEFGSCHRYEPSGSMHGLMRVRGFVQDDGHIFCTEEQIQAEVAAFMELLFAVYKDFGFEEVILRLSTRPTDEKKRVGDDGIWDKSEAALRRALDDSGMDWQLCPGEGAFYGPKIEFSLKDCMGRVQQCGTVQVDFSMPGLLGAEYVDEHSARRTPVMLHRAVLGSFERFIGVLIEHYAGALPPWLAPLQAVVLNITERQEDYCRELAESLNQQGFRADADLRNETIGLKIREHSLQKTPYLLVVGDKEVAAGTVAVRSRGGDDLGVMPVDDFCAMLQQRLIERTSE